MNVAVAALGVGSTSVSNHTASLFDDALMDTSSVEDVVVEFQNLDNSRGNGKKAKSDEANCVQETIIDLLFCRAMDSAAPFLAKNGSNSGQPARRTNDINNNGEGLCGQVLCQPEEGQEYSLETFLGPCQAKEAWI